MSCLRRPRVYVGREARPGVSHTCRAQRNVVDKRLTFLGAVSGPDPAAVVQHVRQGRY